MKVVNYQTLAPFLKMGQSDQETITLLVTGVSGRGKQITVAPSPGIEFHLEVEKALDVKKSQSISISLTGETEGTIVKVNDAEPVLSLESKPGSGSTMAVRNQ